MINCEPLTFEQKEYISQIFSEYERQMNQQYDEVMAPELAMLSKYRGELARNYDAVKGQRNALLGLMKDILDKQDMLIGMCNQLSDMVAHVEGYFLKDIPPEKSQDE